MNFPGVWSVDYLKKKIKNCEIIHKTHRSVPINPPDWGLVDGQKTDVNYAKRSESVEFGEEDGIFQVQNWQKQKYQVNWYGLVCQWVFRNYSSKIFKKGYF